MKNYERRYKKTFSSDATFEKCDLSKVSTDIGMPTEKYIDLIQQQVLEFQAVIFEYLVKLKWLLGKFVYDGKPRTDISKSNGPKLDTMFTIFMRNYVGFSQNIITKNYMNSKIMSYFKDFFPDFEIKNPFEDPEYFQYPYSVATFEHICLVYQMPERLELLQYAEKNSLSYVDFFDYVVNYIHCYNEEHGETYTVYGDTRAGYPFIRFLRSTKVNRYCERCGAILKSRNKKYCSKICQDGVSEEEEIESLKLMGIIKDVE